MPVYSTITGYFLPGSQSAGKYLGYNSWSEHLTLIHNGDWAAYRYLAFGEGVATFHARAGSLHAVMCHTYSLGIFSLRFNGIEVGEIGTDAAMIALILAGVLVIHLFSRTTGH